MSFNLLLYNIDKVFKMSTWFPNNHHTNYLHLFIFTDLEELNPQLIKYGDTQVLYQGILYFRSSSYKGKTYWRCSNLRSHDCKARFQTMRSEIIKPYLVHNHSTFTQANTILKIGERRKSDNEMKFCDSQMML